MEGFVTISPQQCILVRDLQFDEIADQYEIRTALESFVVRELARRITEPQIRELRISLKRQHEISSTSEVDIWVEHDAAFHLLLAKQQGNQAIYRVMLDLKDRMHRIISRVFRLQPLRAEESLEEHTSIVESIIAGKGDEAANFVTVHLQRGRDLVLAPKK